jgi:hypothetical protein
MELHSGCARFESRQGHRLRLLSLSVVLLGPVRPRLLPFKPLPDHHHSAYLSTFYNLDTDGVK